MNNKKTNTIWCINFCIWRFLHFFLIIFFADACFKFSKINGQIFYLLMRHLISDDAQTQEGINWLWPRRCVKTAIQKHSSDWSDWRGKVQLLQFRQLNFSWKNYQQGLYRKLWTQSHYGGKIMFAICGWKSSDTMHYIPYMLCIYMDIYSNHDVLLSSRRAVTHP